MTKQINVTLLAIACLLSFACQEGDSITDVTAVPALGDGQCSLGETFPSEPACPPPAEPTDVVVTLSASYEGNFIIQGTATASPSAGVATYQWKLFKGGTEVDAANTTSATKDFNVAGRPDPCGRYTVSVSIIAKDEYAVGEQANDKGVTISDTECEAQ